METRTIGVVGAGVMGGGVAHNLAQTNHHVVLVDISREQLAKTEGEIRRNLRFQSMFSKAAIQESPESVLARIEFTTDIEALAKASFVVENVTEKWEVKAGVYRAMDAICRPDAVFAVNTSAICITKVAAATKRADRVVGMHFMNPVPHKNMVEVIRGWHTSEATLETAKAFLAGMGKDCVVVNDSPGFVSNRVLMLTVNEAIYLVQENVAKAEEVDLIFKRCFEHKMGPLETADMIGLDTILYSLDVLYESFNDSKYRPCTLLKKMVDAGLHGRKSGRGFYEY